jgi:hypothetical protein
VSSKCFEHPSVHPYPSINQNACKDARNKYNKTACTNLSEDEYLDFLNVLKTIYTQRYIFCIGSAKNLLYFFCIVEVRTIAQACIAVG